MQNPLARDFETSGTWSHRARKRKESPLGQQSKDYNQKRSKTGPFHPKWQLASDYGVFTDYTKGPNGLELAVSNLARWTNGFPSSQRPSQILAEAQLWYQS